MSRKIWLVLAVAALVAVSFAASVIAAKEVDREPRQVRHARPRLPARTPGRHRRLRHIREHGLGRPRRRRQRRAHGQQRLAREGQEPLRLPPVHRPRGGEHRLDVANAPVYYSRLIMAYVAMDRAGTIGTAGSKGVNLLTVLLTYQNTADGSPNKGAFAPSLPSHRRRGAHHQPGRILAMHNAGVSRSDARYLLAVAWLADAAERRSRGDGGFSSSELGRHAPTPSTPHWPIQALRSPTPTGTDWDADCARWTSCKSSQKADGGFSSTPGGAHGRRSHLGGDPGDPRQRRATRGADWRVGTRRRSPRCSTCSQTNGSYKSTPSSHLRPVTVTSWASSP